MALPPVSSSLLLPWADTNDHTTLTWLDQEPDWTTHWPSKIAWFSGWVRSLAQAMITQTPAQNTGGTGWAAGSDRDCGWSVGLSLAAILQSYTKCSWLCNLSLGTWPSPRYNQTNSTVKQVLTNRTCSDIDASTIHPRALLKPTGTTTSVSISTKSKTSLVKFVIELQTEEMARHFSIMPW